MPYITSEKSEDFNLYDLRSFIGDFSFAFLFQLSFPFIERNPREGLVISALAKSTILPAYSIEDKTIDFRDRKIKIASTANFDEWNVTFLSDKHHKLRHKFLVWQSLIYDPARWILYSPFSYKKNGTKVVLLSQEGNPVTGYEFFGLFPKRVDNINVGHGQRSITEFVVTFSYDYFVINTTFDMNAFKNISNKETQVLSDISNDIYSKKHIPTPTTFA